MDLKNQFINVLLSMEGEDIEDVAECLAAVVTMEESMRPAPVAPCADMVHQFMPPRVMH